MWSGVYCLLIILYNIHIIIVIHIIDETEYYAIATTPKRYGFPNNVSTISNNNKILLCYTKCFVE